jgi:hypothetical protein
VVVGCRHFIGGRGLDVGFGAPVGQASVSDRGDVHRVSDTPAVINAPSRSIGSSSGLTWVISFVPVGTRTGCGRRLEDEEVSECGCPAIECSDLVVA